MTHAAVSDIDRKARGPEDRRIALWSLIPYLLLHSACVLVIWVGASTPAIVIAFLLYVARMFFITAFYHRYFSHRAFKTSRVVQLLFACLGCTAAQRGPLWWASHHRHHHGTSDSEEDSHSPRMLGFWMSHMGWFLQRKNIGIKEQYVRDWLRFPELVWLERHALIPFFLLGGCLWGAGEFLRGIRPAWGADGYQLLVWGMAVSTVAVYHATYTINSIAHCWGSRRFQTGDDSRNNLLLSIITMGEGWHNNHHWNPAVVRQGTTWWEIDVTYYILKAMAGCGVVWDLRGEGPGRRERRGAAPVVVESRVESTEISAMRDEGPPTNL